MPDAHEETEGGRMSAAKPIVRMSVRAVVETTMHESDLAPAAGAARRMREGAIAHRARQSQGMTAEREYRAEASLAADYETPALCLRVTGRADGLFLREDGVTVIEEIKLGAPGIPLIPAHEAQAAMYGHMLCARDGLNRVCLRVLYVDEQGKRLECYERDFMADARLARFCSRCREAAVWEENKLARRQARDASLGALVFPFDRYRAGQRRFAANVYVALRERKRLFAQAPTGIGKTMAALYPALRAVGEGLTGRVLFLTARTTGRKSAMDALARLHAQGARIMAVEIGAKDKVCPHEVRDCRPEICAYARGFYDRLPDALKEALTMAMDGANFDREAVMNLAMRHEICPFEFSLELSRLCDVIVGDYNYVFDPFVALDSLVSMPGGASLLVDEAHQLAARVRDAHSAAVGLDELTALRRDAGKNHGRKCALYRALTSAIGALRELAAAPEFEAGRLEGPPAALGTAMEQVLDASAAQLAMGGSRCAADAFSLSLAWQFAAGRFDERYVMLASGGERHARAELLCLNAAPDILDKTKRARGCVYFSATLAPFEAARRMLGSEPGDACLALPSPFDPARLRVRVEPIDIRYAAREQTAPQVARAIAAHLRANEGNALIFFPSYAYMGRIYEILLGEEGLDAIALCREARGMTEEEKNALLASFEEGGGRVALCCVLGGGFSEGIDLPGTRLQNVIVVSTGLPQPDERIRAMQAYYDSIGEDGFFLCMTLPGMVRVIQAAGRLIRTDEDSGALLLIDSRYRYAGIRALMKGTLVGDAMGI